MGKMFSFQWFYERKNNLPHGFLVISLSIMYIYIYTLTLREYFLQYIGTRRQTKIITNIVADLIWFVGAKLWRVWVHFFTDM